MKTNFPFCGFLSEYSNLFTGYLDMRFNFFLLCTVYIYMYIKYRMLHDCFPYFAYRNKVPRSQSYQDVIMDPRLLLEEKEQALLASQETVQVMS